MDDTAEDRKAIQSVLQQIMMYPLSEYDGSMKSIDWSTIPKLPNEASGETEIKWVKPETFFDQLPAVLADAPPLPGEEARYAQMHAVLEAAKNDPKLKGAMVNDEMLGQRRYEFKVERAVYLTVLHRLFASGSDRAAERWRECYRIPGTEDLALQHLYRAMAWLGEELGQGMLGSPRCTKDVIEEAPLSASAISLAKWAWCSLIRPPFISKELAGKVSASTAIAKTTGPTCPRWLLAWPSMCAGVRCAAKCGRAIPPTPRVSCPSSNA